MDSKVKKRSKKWIIWTVVILGVVMLAGFKLRAPRQLQGNEIEAKTGDITTYYSFSGSIEAKNRQKVFAEQAMQIKEFNVSVGENVKKDDVLFVTNFGQKIKAKIDGEILDIFVEEGQQVMPGTNVIEIVNYSDLELKVKVDEYDLPAIKNESLANVTIHALSKDIEGRVSDVSKEGVYMNGVTLFTSIISIENDGDILVGMSAEAKVLDESVKGVVTLPMSVIQFDEDNNPFVYIKEENTLNKVQLTLGITDGVHVEVKSGIAAGQKAFVPKDETRSFGPPPMAGRMSSGGSSGGNN